VKTPRKNSTRRGGFTIIEVVLAMGILVLGATAIISFLTYGASTARHAQLRTQAASAVETVLHDLSHQLFPYEDGQLGDPTEIKDREVPGVSGVVYSARAFPNPDTPREYRVDVRMTWQSAGIRRFKKFQTLQLRELPFGERLRREFIEKKAKNTSRDAGANGEPK
jgi:hypothetical protein